MPLIVDDIERHILLRAHQSLIDKRNTGYPVTIRNLAVTLYIVLPSGEVPHEITPIHEIQLISEEITQILGKRRFHHRHHLTATVELHRCTFHLCPLLISSHMTSVATIHTGEKHTQLIHVFVFRIVTRDIITILLVLIFLNDTAPSRLTLFRYRYASTTLVLTFYLRYISLAVDQRSLTVLLTGQIGTQGKDILRSVLVHRRIGCRTNQCQGIG